MKINYEKTHLKLKEEGYSVKGYANSPSRGLNYSSLFRLLTGHWLPKTQEGPQFKRIIKQLRDDGLLVEEEDEDDVAA